MSSANNDECKLGEIDFWKIDLINLMDLMSFFKSMPI